MPRRPVGGAEARGELELTTEGAGVVLGVSAARVRQFIRDGRLRARRFGRDWMIGRSEVARFSSEPRERTGRPKKSLRIQNDLASIGDARQPGGGRERTRR